MTTSLDEQKRLACAEIDSLVDAMRNTATFIGTHPELGFQERNAVRVLTEVLRKHSLEPELGLAAMPTAFRAQRVKGPGPTIAVFVEYDALPEIGHGCGHNISGVAAVAASIAVAKHMSRGVIQVLGSPAEEGNVPEAGGKVHLIDRGLLKGVDAALSTHAGPVSVLKIDYLARSNIEMDFHGKPAHAAMAPEQGINALDAAVLTLNAINALRQHVRSDVRLHGYMAEGGEMVSTIPDFARLPYGIRAQEVNHMEQILERVLNCGRGGAISTGCRFEWRHFVKPYANLMDNAPMLEAFAANLNSLGESYFKYIPVSASTDMGNVSHVVPTIHPTVGYGNPKLVLHTREFAEASCTEPAFRSMILAAKSMAMTCLDLLQDVELLGRVKADFGKTQKPV